MSAAGFGIFDAETPAYGSFNLDLTGASATSGGASNSALSSFIDGAKDFVGLFRDAGKAVTEVKAAISPPTGVQTMVGAGANKVPNKIPGKNDFDPMLIIIGVGIFWLVKNA